MGFKNKLINLLGLTDEDEYDEYDEYEQDNEQIEESYLQYEEFPPKGNKYKSDVFHHSSQGNQKVKRMHPEKEIVAVAPKKFADCKNVADIIKGGSPVILNMEGVESATAQRIIDFVSGCVYNADGTLQSVSDKIFVAAPPAIEVEGDLNDVIQTLSYREV